LNRREQLNEFNKMTQILLSFADLKKIPWRYAEAHRPYFVAERYHQMGIGILNSKHRYSLALDLWVDPTGKNPILKNHKPYIPLGLFWKHLGGRWGGLKSYGGDFNRLNDPYHFEHPLRPQ